MTDGGYSCSQARCNCAFSNCLVKLESIVGSFAWGDGSIVTEMDGGVEVVVVVVRSIDSLREREK